MLALRMRDEDWQAVLDVDLSAPFRLARAALRGMLRRRAGRIIGISSIVGATGNAGQANYAAAKAGLVGMSKALAREVAARGVTVNIVAPGFIETPMTDQLNEAQRAKMMEAIPLGRHGPAGGRGRRGGLSRVGRGRLGHRGDAACQWRDGHGLNAMLAMRVSRQRAESGRRVGACDETMLSGPTLRPGRIGGNNGDGFGASRCASHPPPDLRSGCGHRTGRTLALRGGVRQKTNSRCPSRASDFQRPALSGVAEPMSEIADKVKKIVVEHLGVEEAKVTPEASFIDDLGADSLDTVELVMAFEEAFGVEIPEDAAEKISTVKDAIDYIEKQKAA